MYGNHQIEGGRQAMTELLAHAPEITAVFVLNDLMALGALEAARAAGRSVPDDLSVMGFDNIPFADARQSAADDRRPVDPRAWRARGRPAARRDRARRHEHQVDGSEADPGQPNVLLPSELIVRGSTAAPPRRRQS